MADQLADPTNAGNEPGLGPLRVGGQAPPEGGMTTDKHLPSTRSKASKVQMPALKLVRDLWAGPERVAAETTVYLPKNLGEDDPNYKQRLSRSVFVNFFRRTVEGLVGLIFADDPVLGDDVPPQIVELWENIDLEGTHGDVFVRESLQDAMTAGHSAILVEFPEVSQADIDDGTASRLEAEGVLRPYWVPIKKENILSWRESTVGGRKLLDQVVIAEHHTVPDGPFGEDHDVRYRVLFRRPRGDGTAEVGFVLLKVHENKTVERIGEGLYPTQDEIPIVEVPTSGSIKTFVSQPPLIDLAWLNVAHYQQWSDYAWSLHKTCVPIFVVSGWDLTDDLGDPVPLKLGPNSAVTMSNPQSSASFQSHSGASLQQCKQALDDLKSDMGTLGLTMLAPQKRVAETAESRRIDKSTSDSTLGVTARSDQDAIEQALQFTANYMNLPEGGSITINRDFDQMAMDPAVMTAYATLIGQGYPLDVALEMLKRGKRLPEDADVEALEMQMIAEQAAKEEQRKLEEERLAQETLEAEE